MPLTLGLILPWREAALERYKMRNSYYGDLQGSFAGRGWEFFKRGWGVWLFAVVSLIVLFVILPFARYLPALLPLSIIAQLFAPFIPLAAPFLYAIFKVIEWRWWLSGIRFGDVRLESKLSGGALIGVYWKVIGWLLLMLAVFVGYFFLCVTLVARARQLPMAKLFTAGNLQENVPMLVLLGIGYLGLVLSLNVVMRIYLLRDVWGKLVQSIAIYDIDAAADVAARGYAVNALGEGFADGLDVAGF